MEIIAFFIYLVIFLVIAGYSSGYETGLISIPLSEVELQREKGEKNRIWLVEKFMRV